VVCVAGGSGRQGKSFTALTWAGCCSNNKGGNYTIATVAPFTASSAARQSGDGVNGGVEGAQ
jgi:hypothetical protein